MPGPDSIRVLIVEDHHLVAEAVAAILRAEDDIEVVAVVHTIADAREQLGTLEVDVILLDQRLPDGQGTRSAPGFLAQRPGVHIVILTAASDDSVLAEALRVGCSGYVNKTESLAQLTASVRAAHAGATSVSPQMLQRALTARGGQNLRGEALTRRETEVLALLAQGTTNPRMCQVLGISPNTLRNHIQNILGKLGAHSKLEAVTIALREGLISAPQQES